MTLWNDLFVLVKRLNEGAVCLKTNADRALWTKRRLRKDTFCRATGKVLKTGESHFGPIGNQLYRSWRLSDEYVTGLETLNTLPVTELERANMRKVIKETLGEA
jgi:hypothetical protein